MQLIKRIITIAIIAAGIFYLGETQLALGFDKPKAGNREGEKIYEVFSSSNQKHLIYSRVNNPQAPELFLYQFGQRYQTKHQQITNSPMLEYNPVVNNQGVYAYAAFDLRDNSSSIFLKGKVIRGKNRKGFYKSLAISNDYLLAVYETYANQHYLFIYNQVTSQFKFLPIKATIYMERLEFITAQKVLIQAYNLASHSMDIFLFDLNRGQLKPMFNSPQTEVIDQVNFAQGTFTIKQLVEGGENLRLLYNGYYYLEGQRSLIALSKLNDFSGMLSWNVAYRLEGLIKLYDLVKDEKIKQQIRIIVVNILRNTNGYNGVSNKNNPKFLWASKKYTMNHETPISFLVNNARIYYPLLLACNKDLLDTETKAKILTNAEEMYNYYEQFYNQKERLYHFPKEISYWADGLWLPFNQQNTLGLVMIELYEATKDEKYQRRVLEIAAKFREEMEYQRAGQGLVWHYWPKVFYQGWNQESKISSNTPSKIRSRDNLYEDINHAGINVKFICSFYKTINQQVFKEQDLQAISMTLDNLIKQGFSPYLNSLNNLQPKGISTSISNKLLRPRGYRFIPQYGWVELNNQKLKQLYLNLLPQTSPHFNSNMDLNSYLSFINTKELYLEKLIVKGWTYNNKLKLVNTQVKTYNAKTLDTCFGPEYKKS